MGEGLSHGFLIQIRKAVQFLLKRGLFRYAGHIRMVEGMIAHHMTLRRHAADNIRGGFDHMAHHKEGGRSAVFFQHVQDLRGITVLVAAVKG